MSAANGVKEVIAWFMEPPLAAIRDLPADIGRNGV
jgi:hypothetical protein